MVCQTNRISQFFSHDDSAIDAAMTPEVIDTLSDACLAVGQSNIFVLYSIALESGEFLRRRVHMDHATGFVRAWNENYPDDPAHIVPEVYVAFAAIAAR